MFGYFVEAFNQRMPAAASWGSCCMPLLLHMMLCGVWVGFEGVAQCALIVTTTLGEC